MMGNRIGLRISTILLALALILLPVFAVTAVVSALQTAEVTDYVTLFGVLAALVPVPTIIVGFILVYMSFASSRLRALSPTLLRLVRNLFYIQALCIVVILVLAEFLYSADPPLAGFLMIAGVGTFVTLAILVDLLRQGRLAVAQPAATSNPTE